MADRVYCYPDSDVLKNKMIRASEDSFLCNYEGMELLFSKCIRRRN